MLWLAVLPAVPHTPEAQWVGWALGFTPRVTCHEGAVLLEVSGSCRLMGGWPRLRQRLLREAAMLGAQRLAWAPLGHTALVLARSGLNQAGVGPEGQVLEAASWHPVLDGVPLAALGPSVQDRLEPLAQLGCRTLGDLSNLPRPGLARRFGPALLALWDRCYGRASESWEWQSVSECFDVRRELSWRQDNALALLQEAQPLLLQLRSWLAARHLGVRALTLYWLHDSFRSRHCLPGGEITVRTAHPMADLAHVRRLLAQHLGRHTLGAAVAELGLRVDEAQAMQEHTPAWWPQAQAQTQSQQALLEYLAARLGAQRVLRPSAGADHRPEHTGQWLSATAAEAQFVAGQPTVVPSWPQPLFLLASPKRLSMSEHRPQFCGGLQLLLGPQRIEAGWWQHHSEDTAMHAVWRDYWVAHSPKAGMLCVFRSRDRHEQAWYLHGFYA